MNSCLLSFDVSSHLVVAIDCCWRWGVTMVTTVNSAVMASSATECGSVRGRCPWGMLAPWTQDEPIHHPQPARRRHLRQCRAWPAHRHRREGGHQEVGHSSSQTFLFMCKQSLCCLFHEGCSVTGTEVLKYIKYCLRPTILYELLLVLLFICCKWT